MPLDTQASFQIQTVNTGAALDLAVTPTALLQYVKAINLLTGTGANQADLIFTDQRTIAASGTDDLDVAGGVTNQLTGATFSFVRIKGIIVYAATANTNNVIVGGAAANALINWSGGQTHQVNVRPGGLFVLLAMDATAYAVTAATADILRFTNSGAGTGVTYDVILIGASA